jgi:hypothetical protein
VTRLSQCVRFLLAALLLAALPCHAQVVRIGGGASTIADSQGAAVTVYQSDATTQTSLGYAQGIHLGGSREVRSGNTFLAAGDSNVSLDLPTDLPGGGRSMSVRGALVGTLDERRAALGSADNILTTDTRPRISGSAFAGWTGDGYRNAFFSSVTPTHAIAFATARMAVTKTVDLSAVVVRGSRSSMLASVAWRPQFHSAVATTAGFSGGKAIFRAAAHSSGITWQAQGNYTSGALHLQPEPTLASLNLERIGWNFSLNKRVGNWLWLDGARHEFATADAVDRKDIGISAGRSTLYEAGATIRVGHAEAGGRGLQSISGVMKSGGYVFIAGWNATRWNVRGTTVRNMDPNGVVTRSATIDTTERINSHLQLTQGTSFANGAPSFDFGGAYENRHGAFTISHRETFVPFGNQAGFHRVLAIGMRLHLGNSELAVDQISGGGLKTVYNVAIDSFHGESLGAVSAPGSHMASLPRYAVRGRVLTTGGEPVRGAAVTAGTQTVYTDSEGLFMARFRRTDEVRLSLQTAAFLTAETYSAVTEPLSVQPFREDSAQVLQLQVQRCRGCAVEEKLNASAAIEESLAVTPKKPHSALFRIGAQMVQLTKRMLRLRPSASARAEA